MAALLLVIGVAVTIAQEAAEPMDKPLGKFTIGDLFPKLSAGLRETAAAWKESSANAADMTAQRLQNIQAAIPKVKTAMDQAKAAGKAADKSKDFTAAGTAQGEIKTQEMVMKVLDRLQAVSAAQNDVSKSWSKAADAMQKFADADDAFDQYRSAGIAKPDAGAQDTRLDAAGYQAFKAQSQALKDLGDAFQEFGSKLGGLGAGRL
jgi:hypothetical protein